MFSTHLQAHIPASDPHRSAGIGRVGPDLHCVEAFVPRFLVTHGGSIQTVGLCKCPRKFGGVSALQRLLQSYSPSGEGGSDGEGQLLCAQEEKGISRLGT